MSYGEIYIIGNFVNDKLYVGQTKKGIKVRWDSHIHNAIREGKEYTPKCLIDRAIRKYGKENFCMYIVDTAKDQDELNEKRAQDIIAVRTKIETLNNSLGLLQTENSNIKSQNNSLNSKGYLDINLFNDAIKSINIQIYVYISILSIHA